MRFPLVSVTFQTLQVFDGASHLCLVMGLKLGNRNNYIRLFNKRVTLYLLENLPIAHGQHYHPFFFLEIDYLITTLSELLIARTSDDFFSVNPNGGGLGNYRTSTHFPYYINYSPANLG